MLVILYAVLILGALGGLFGLVLAVASKIFEVKKDPRIGEVLSTLPGANCGGCGFAGCAAGAGERLPGVLRGPDHPHCGHYGRGCHRRRAAGGLRPLRRRHPGQPEIPLHRPP